MTRLSVAPPDETAPLRLVALLRVFRNLVPQNCVQVRQVGLRERLTSVDESRILRCFRVFARDARGALELSVTSESGSLNQTLVVADLRFRCADRFRILVRGSHSRVFAFVDGPPRKSIVHQPPPPYEIVSEESDNGNYRLEARDRKRSLLIKSVLIDIPATAADSSRRSEDRRAGSGTAEYLSGAPLTCEIGGDVSPTAKNYEKKRMAMELDDSGWKFASDETPDRGIVSMPRHRTHHSRITYVSPHESQQHLVQLEPVRFREEPGPVVGGVEAPSRDASSPRQALAKRHRPGGLPRLSPVKQGG